MPLVSVRRYVCTYVHSNSLTQQPVPALTGSPKYVRICTYQPLPSCYCLPSQCCALAVSPFYSCQFHHLSWDRPLVYPPMNRRIDFVRVMRLPYQFWSPCPVCGISGTWFCFRYFLVSVEQWAASCKAREDMCGDEPDSVTTYVRTYVRT